MQQWYVLFDRENEIWAYLVEASDEGEAVDVAESWLDTPNFGSIASFRIELMEEFKSKLYKPIVEK
jgi:hypothetical protein